MSLRHILLGMLDEPASGYDLKKEFNQSLRHFWRAELSQIYPQLQQMEKQGLLRSDARESPKGPPRRIYRRTKKGRDELVTWLADGPKLGEERIAYLAQVYFLENLGDNKKIIEFMETLRDYMANWLEQLLEAEQCWKSADDRYPDALPDQEFYQQLTLAMGLVKVRANLDWCDTSLRRIRAREERKISASRARSAN